MTSPGIEPLFLNGICIPLKGEFSYGINAGDNINYDLNGRFKRVGTAYISYDLNSRVNKVGRL